MTASPKPLTPEELAEGKELVEDWEKARGATTRDYCFRQLSDWLVIRSSDFLAAAERLVTTEKALFQMQEAAKDLTERLAECERQLALHKSRADFFDHIFQPHVGMIGLALERGDLVVARERMAALLKDWDEAERHASRTKEPRP